MPTDTASTVIKTLQRAGFRGERLRTAFGIVMAESGGNPRAHNPDRSTGDDSYGLAQINMLGAMGPARRKQYGLQSNADLFDPTVNARVMFRMSGGGRDFSPWSTFKTGAYRRHPFPGVAPAGDTPGQAAPSSSAPPGGPSSDKLGLALALIQRSRARRGDTDSSALMQALSQRASETQDAPAVAGDDGRDNDRPVYSGGALTLPALWKGTHITDGLDWNQGRRTATDIMARAGTPVLAPVAGQVVRWGSAQGGEAMYLDDNDPDTEPDFWLGHVDSRIPAGTRFRRGQRIARISADHPRPHAHWDRKL